ncbi:Drf_GBD domain-containing protein [Pseudozyma hubeiensis]|nr:Drf_GBD domain-containing protein [Pseudozyma hubeiensis]
MASVFPTDSNRIRPGQYSRQHSDVHIGKENEPLSPRGRQQYDAAKFAEFASTAAQPIAIDPKYRLRGNSPEDTDRASRSKLSSSFSPKKGLRSRSRSRSRLFGKDKTDTLNSQACSSGPQQYAATRTPEQIDADFLDLLDELQVQPEMRQRLLGLNSTVKANMLQGQASLSLAAFGINDASSSTMSSSPTKATRMPIPDLLKGRSASRPNSTIYTTSPLLDQPSTFHNSNDSAEMMAPPNTAQLYGAGPPRQVSSGSVDSGSSGSGGHAKQPSNTSRSAIRDAFKRSTPNLGQGGSFISLAASSAGGTSSAASTARPRSMSFGKEFAASFGKETPESFATMLKCTDASRIDVARVKRMRAVLAAESPAWISTFIAPECGGYDAMLTRLDELLAMEWREEQHDDMLLHELLRCFVALSTTEVGRNALASQAPRPFRQLVDLLFSEKKPGDLGTRKLMVEMLVVLLDLQLPAEQSHSQSSLNYLLDLLQNPSDPAKDSVVDFIKQTHAPRPFKTYVVEVSCVCRDYFWIFCHSQNFYWRFEELVGDKMDLIRGPKVPGGMTGGVEFEAMAYLTVHLKLINAIAGVLGRVKEHQLPRPVMTAGEFHAGLFMSGLERVLVTLRKSSQHYYAGLHLELARYLWLARQAGFELPCSLTDWLERRRVECAPLLPPLQLPQLSATKITEVAAPSGAGGGYGMAGPFINTPIRGSSHPDAVRSPTIARSNASRSPTKSPRQPHQSETDDWDFSTAPLPPPAATRHVETVPFSDSQFSLFSTPTPPEVGMPSSSTSKRILGLNEAVSQDLTIHRQRTSAPERKQTSTAALAVPQLNASGRDSVVGSAVKKWESMSVSHQPASPTKVAARRG